jgi:TonB-dependent starch-binding outer membrane protein SusC
MKLNYYLLIALLFLFSATATTSVMAAGHEAAAFGNVARITGRVTDETGAGVPGATVRVKGTSVGAVTDANGNYQIEAERGATLVISYTGYTNQEVVVGASTVIDVQIAPDANTLQDVVVVGYGSVRKSDLTGSVSSIKAGEIKAFPTASVDQALTARATGINVTQASGAPGGAVTVRIRGSNSIISGSEPLYVVDGIPIYSNNDAFSAGGNRTASNALASLNPADIESVEILKDASGTSIYGSRGANGVVLITTKRGKAGATRVDYEGSHSFQQVARSIDLMNASEYATFQNARAASRGQAAPFPNAASLGEGVNWLDETTRTGEMLNHQLTFSGGSDKTTFAVMPGYFKNTGIVKNSDFERLSLRTNVDSRFLNDRLRLGTSNMVSRTVGNSVPTDRGGPGGAIITILGQSPIGPVFNEDGTYKLEPYDGRFLTNPLAEVEEVVDQDKGTRLLSNTYLAYELMKGLTLKTTFGFDLYSGNRETYYSSLTRLGRERSRSYELGNRNITNILNENTLNYSTSFGKSRLDVLGGYTYQTDNNRFFTTSSNGFTFEDLEINRIQNGVKPLTPSSSRNEWVLRSFLGRVNYALMDKYLVTVTFRRDGSSKFGAENKWANFPSIALAWRAKQESFLADVDAISDLKFRLSYGLTGNSELPAGNSLAELSGNKNALFGDVVAAGVAESRVANPELRWETTSMFNFGIDLGLMDGRIGITADVFQSQTKDLLLFVALPTSTGFSSALKNSGELQNRGLELSANIAAVRNADINWNVGINTSFLRNEVTSLAGTPSFYSYVGSHLGPEGSYVTEGQPLGGWNGYDYIGIWQSAQEIASNPSLTGIDKPGYARYRDVNGDGTINLDDRTYLGDPNPRFIWGVTNDFRFKGLDVNIFIRGAHGQKIRNLQASEHADGIGNYNQYRVVATDSWSENNRGGTRPVVDALREFPSYFRRSNFFIEDGSFVRLQNVALGYTLPKVNGVRSMRIYVSGQNVALWTNYTGFDPEVSNGGQSPLNRGDDYDAYPRPRTYTLGVQLGL